MARGWIDTSGSTPRLKVGAVATGILGTLLVGVQSGYLSIIEAIGGGYSSTADAIASFLSGGDGLIPSLFDFAIGVGHAAAVANGEWIRETFGAFGILAAFVEGFLIIYLVIWGVRTAITRALGAI